MILYNEAWSLSGVRSEIVTLLSVVTQFTTKHEALAECGVKLWNATE